jgi:endonuclease/exonuclease/phosphatase family metal-dependent hydrolase
MIRALAALSLLVASCAPLRMNAPSVRVLVYNIHAGTDADRVSNIARVADIIVASGADIVLLQEVDRGTRRSGGIDQLDSLRKLTRMHGVFGRTIDYDGGEYGLGILSRWRVVKDSVFPLPVAEPHQGYEARGALVVEVESPAGRIVAIDTHLDASRPVYRTQQSSALLRIAREEGADLVGGDLNSEPADGVIGALRAGGLSDLYPECGPVPGFTFPAVEPVKRIDYLLVNDRWRCVSASVLPALASDHRAVLFEIVRR